MYSLELFGVREGTSASAYKRTRAPMSWAKAQTLRPYIPYITLFKLYELITLWEGLRNMTA